jgi:hypothetical protein
MLNHIRALDRQAVSPVCLGDALSKPFSKE